MAYKTLDHDVYLITCDPDLIESEMYNLVKVPGKYCTITYGAGLDVRIDNDIQLKNGCVRGNHGKNDWFDNEADAINHLTFLRQQQLIDLKQEVEEIEELLKKPVTIASIA